jgi:hypothetical protein
MSNPSTTPPQPPTPPNPLAPTINIGEEYGTAKKNLPPASVLIVAIAVLAAVVVFASFLKRAKPQASGTLDNVAAVEVAGQGTTMVALTFTLHNTSDKVLYVHNIQSSMKAPSGDATADALSAIDFDRYYQAFPALKNGAQPALVPEAKIQPGETVTRTIIVNYPIKLDAFNRRQTISVILWLYDQQLPILLTK